MVKREKQDLGKGNAIHNIMHKSNPGSLKDDPDGETICHSDFSDGCLNEDTDSAAISEEEDEYEKY